MSKSGKSTTLAITFFLFPLFFLNLVANTDFDNQYLGNRKSDSNDFFQFKNLWFKDY